MQVSSMVVKLRKEAPRTFILSNNHIPSKAYWEFAVNQALQIISRSDSELAKVLTAYVLSLFEALTNSGSEWRQHLQISMLIIHPQRLNLQLPLEIKFNSQSSLFPSLTFLPFFIFVYLFVFINESFLGNQVVLARSSRVITATDIDPITWLACLQVLFSSLA